MSTPTTRSAPGVTDRGVDGVRVAIGPESTMGRSGTACVSAPLFAPIPQRPRPAKARNRGRLVYPAAVSRYGVGNS